MNEGAENMLALFRILEGSALLILGRQLFWFFVALIGFEVGAYVAARIFTHQPDWIVLVIAIVVGIIGTALVALLFDWALIGLSSLVGALTLTNVFLPRSALALLATIVLFIIGVSIQAAWWQSGKRRN
jgi:hypothetical protein